MEKELGKEKGRTRDLLVKIRAAHIKTLKILDQIIYLFDKEENFPLIESHLKQIQALWKTLYQNLAKDNLAPIKPLFTHLGFPKNGNSDN